MPSLIRSCIAACFFAAASVTSAASLPEPARAEIQSLLAALQSSGCEFKRNGTWYSGADARSHLQRKLDYLADRNAIATAEQFIQLGATESSSSGKPYLVRCGNAPETESRIWLNAKLSEIRKQK